MVAIDMEMPNRCITCRLLGQHEMICSLFPRRTLDVISVATSKPDWCPLINIDDTIQVNKIDTKEV